MYKYMYVGYESEWAPMAQVKFRLAIIARIYDENIFEPWHVISNNVAFWQV